MIIYICDFGIDISVTHVCILMEELYFEFSKTYKLDFKGRFEKNPKSGQQLNCELKNAFIRVRFLDKLMLDATLASAQTLRLAFLQISDIWSRRTSLIINMI